MSVGSGKHMRRWRNVGGIMSNRYRSEDELRARFGQDRPKAPKPLSPLRNRCCGHGPGHAVDCRFATPSSPIDILELFKDGYLSVAETIAALEQAFKRR